jgi:O-succinylbenzoic acid--CoA ligase
LAVPTSGSTGAPKLVALSGDAIRASARASAERLGGTGNWLLALPTDHIAGLNVVIRAFLAGAAPSPMPPRRFTPEAFAAASAALPPGPRFTSLVPTQLRRLLAGRADGIVALRTFGAVLVGGAALDPELRARAEAAGVRVVETYGSAETCGGCVYDGMPLAGVEVVFAPESAPESASRSAPQSAPAPDTGGRIEIAGPTLAPESTPRSVFEPAPEPMPQSAPTRGAGGRIQISGPMLALGYALERLQAPDGPARQGSTGFFERDGRRWFASSDLGRWTADGRLSIDGRADNALTTGGHTVAPERVESVLRALPGVAEILVVGLADAAWGEAVTALVVPDAAGPPTLGQLRREVKGHLDQAHAPRNLGVVPALPILAPGKPDRRAAGALAAELAASGKLERLG